MVSLTGANGLLEEIPVAEEEYSSPYGENGDEEGARSRRPRKVCTCDDLTYKQVDGFRQYLTERGKILPARKTGLCARCQRKLAVEVKRARHLALLPFVSSLQRLSE